VLQAEDELRSRHDVVRADRADRRADREELGRVTATMPSAPSTSASASIRVIASSRAWYIAWDSTSISWFLVHRLTCRPTW
jgi:hypothetical protein